MATQKRFIAKNGLDNNAQTITNLATPVNTTDAVTKAYADLKPDLSSTTPAALGVAAVGTGTTAARADHVHAMGNLTGDVTSVGLATTLTNAPVIAKVLTGYVSGAGTVSATDSILGAIQKLNGNTPIASSTTPAALGTAAVGTGTTFARADHVHQSPTTVSGNAGTATSIAGGVANNVPYQTAVGTTAFVPVSTVAGQVLTTAAAGGAPTWVTPTAASGSGFTNIQVYTTTTTWTIPTGITKCKVTVVAGGGAGGSSTTGGTSTCSSPAYNGNGGGGGGGGGTAIKYVTGLVPGGTVVCTVGAAGGASSFGANCSATAGTAGSTGTGDGAAGGAGGIGSSGSINITGGGGAGVGAGVGTNSGCAGGNGGMSKIGANGSGGKIGQAGRAGTLGGGGGGSGGGLQSGVASGAGGAGGAGIIIIEY